MYVNIQNGVSSDPAKVSNYVVYSGNKYHCPIYATNNPNMNLPLPTLSQYYYDGVLANCNECINIVKALFNNVTNTPPPSPLGYYGADGCFYPYNQQRDPEQSPSSEHTLRTNDNAVVEICRSNKTVKLKGIPDIRSYENILNVEKIYQNFHPAPFPSVRPLLLGIRPSKYAPKFMLTMDFTYGKSCLSPLFDTQNLGPPFPILQHQFLSQPISPLLSTFIAPHHNRIPPSPTQSSWTPATLLPQPITHHHEIVPPPTHDMGGIPAFFHHPVDQPTYNPLLGFKGLLLKPKNHSNLNNGQENIDASGQQGLCFPPYMDISLDAAKANGTLNNNSTCPVVPIPRISKSSSFHIGYYVPPNVSPGDPFGGIDVVWKNHFDLLFRSFHPHIWSFGPTENSLSDWKVFKDMAKVRFSCQNCQHGWTSMHGVVVFYFKFDHFIGRGEVRFVLTGQKCIDCQSQNFETPMWYPEEAQKVMTNLYYEIASSIYMLATPPRIKDRRLGRPLKKHVASNCQGCHLGVCKPPPPPSEQTLNKNISDYSRRPSPNLSTGQDEC